MPGRKPSLGKIRFQSPYPDEFQRYLMYELANVKQWNKEKFTLIPGINKWTFNCTDKIPVESHFKIYWDGTHIYIESKLSIVFIRQGLVINMGQARIEISGQA